MEMRGSQDLDIEGTVILKPSDSTGPEEFKISKMLGLLDASLNGTSD